MMKTSKWLYYGRSIGTLLTGFKNPLKILGIFSGVSKKFPAKVEVKNNDLQFFVGSPMDVWVIKETCIDRDYIPGKGEIQAGWNIIDIGGGLGDFTMLAAKKSSTGVVHAYEPLLHSMGLLKQNIELNRCTNVVCFNEAVASQDGRMKISSGDVEAVSSQFKTDQSTGAGTVPATALEKVLSRLPKGKCDFLKIDCEGGEYDILLKSPSECLKKIDRISLEYHDGFTPYSHQQLEQHLRQNGFDVQTKSNPVHDYLGLMYAERKGL